MEDVHAGGLARRIAFVSDEALVPTDTDGAPDVYLSEAGGYVVLTNQPGPGSRGGPSIVGVSTDTRTVVFRASEQDPGETYAAQDIYVADEAHLVTASPGTPSAVTPSRFTPPEADTVWFSTNDALLPSDTDRRRDLYQWTSVRGVEHVSDDPAETLDAIDPDVDSQFVAGSADGRRTLFTSKEALDPSDTDDAIDLYLYEAASDVSSLTFVSGGIAKVDVGTTVSNADLSAAWFESDEPILPLVDTDTTSDVYEWRDGLLRVASDATIGGPDAHAWTRLVGPVEGDGSAAWFATTESLVAEDGDVVRDVYVREANGAVRLLTPRTELDAYALLRLRSGEVVISTSENLDPADTDWREDYVALMADGWRRLVAAGIHQIHSVT